MCVRSPVHAAGLRLFRDTVAARRSLTTSGPQPEERTGHGPSGGSLRSGQPRRTRPVPRAHGAREPKPLSGGGAGRRPAPGESRYIATGTPAMSPPLGGPIALTAASRLSPMATAERVELTARTRRPGRPPSPADATDFQRRADTTAMVGRTVPGSTRTARTESLSTTRSSTLDPLRLRPRQGDGCDTGADDGMSEKDDAISKRHNRHQGIQHRSSNLGSLRCWAPSCSQREPQAMSVISGPVYCGEVAVPQRAINRGTGQ